LGYSFFSIFLDFRKTAMVSRHRMGTRNIYVHLNVYTYLAEPQNRRRQFGRAIRHLIGCRRKQSARTLICIPYVASSIIHTWHATCTHGYESRSPYDSTFWIFLQLCCFTISSEPDVTAEAAEPSRLLPSRCNNHATDRRDEHDAGETVE
jgi:predicted CopG family antitoxin